MKVKTLFESPFNKLKDWNKSTILLIDGLLNLGLDISETTVFQKTYEGKTDLRHTLAPQHQLLEQVPGYYQVFADRCGFQQDCSILDLVFNEGLHSRAYLKSLLP